MSLIEAKVSEAEKLRKEFEVKINVKKSELQTAKNRI